MAKSLATLLLLLQLISFNVFAKELESLHKPTPLHPPANAPRLHNQYRNLLPTSAHAPLHPSNHAKPPTHHQHQHPPAHAPVPHHQPLHPAKPPTHHHHPHPPSHAPIRHHQPLQPPTHHHHQHPPAHAPVQPPTNRNHHHPPTRSPVHQHPPAHSPVDKPARVYPPFRVPIPIESQIAVEGVVYVKSCKHAGVETLLNATSLNGAVVKLQCNNTKHNVVRKGKTDKNGYFYIKGSKDISSFAAHKCNIVLDSAPNGLKPSNLHGGISGALLKRKKSFVSKGHNLILYNVRPLAFEPKCPH